MRARQGNSFAPTKGSWIVVDYLSSLLKGTELSSLILNFLITNNDAGVAVEATAVLDLIDVKLTRDGNKKLIDCTLGDLLRICMIKQKTNYDSIGSVALGGGTFNAQVVIPFADKARPNPKDTSIVVDTLKSLQLEIRDNNVANHVIGNIETMQIIEDAKTSLRICSDRFITRSGISIAGAINKSPYPVQEAHRTLALLVGTRTNLSYLQVDGGKDPIIDGEPDEVLSFALDSLDINPPDTAWTSAGVNMLATALPIPFVANGDGYGSTESQPLNFRFDTAGALSLFLVEDFIEMPDTKKIQAQIRQARPASKPAQLKISAVGKYGQRLSTEQTSKAVVIPQLKVSDINATTTASNPATSDINLEASLNRF